MVDTTLCGVVSNTATEKGKEYVINCNAAGGFLEIKKKVKSSTFSIRSVRVFDTALENAKVRCTIKDTCKIFKVNAVGSG